MNRKATSRLAGSLVVCFSILGFWACHSSSANAGRKQRLTITGSSTVAPLVLEMARRYEKEHPDTRIDVQTGGSSRGIRDAREGLADIGMVSRSLKADETDLTPFPIAHDGVGLIVHRDNPIASLTDEQVRAIYLGDTQHWSELQGLDLPITVVNKAEGRSTLELFLKYYQLKNTDIRAKIVIGDNEQGIKTVAGAPSSVGYVSIGTAEYDIAQGVPIRLLPIEGVAATRANVANQSFPLSRALNLVVRGPMSPLAKDFIDFAQSVAVEDLVEAMYFVPIPR